MAANRCRQLRRWIEDEVRIASEQDVASPFAQNESAPEYPGRSLLVQP
jgi:hypothetical protein